MVSGRGHRSKLAAPSPQTHVFRPESRSTFAPSTTSIPASITASSTHPYSGNVPEPRLIYYSAATGIAPIADDHTPINENDIIIAVVGLTGAGKSTFVNRAAGRTVSTVDSLWPQTQAVQPVRCTHPDGYRSIILVDTPGFDDIHRSDTEVLKMIATWLTKTYQSNIKLTGVLYLHRISDNRVTQTSLRSLSVFRDLCGDRNLKNVVLVTTMWGEVEESMGSERENQLISDSEFWNVLMHHGSRTCRFLGTRESAWEIVNCLDLEGSRRAPLQIQQEMVDRRLPFEKTSAAKTMLRPLADLKRLWKKISNKILGKGSSRVSDAQGRHQQALSGSTTTGFPSSGPSNLSVPMDSSSSGL